MDKYQEAYEAVQKTGGNLTAAARLLGIDRHAVKRRLRKCYEQTGATIPLPVAQVSAKPKANVSPRTLNEFKQKYDKSTIIPSKIREGIVTVLSRGWLYDAEFREACGVPPGNWRRFADDFSEYHTKRDGKIIWAMPEMIEQMEAMR